MKKRFAFIVHLRTIDDIAHTLPVPNIIITKVLRRPILWLLSKLSGRAGFMVRSKFPVNHNIEGYIIVIWLTGAQIMSGNSFARKRVLEAVLYAQNNLKCDVIGLGALTASITSAGRWLAEKEEVKSTITHGDSYATALSIDGILRIASQQGFVLENSSMAIVGATGIIGEALSRFFAVKVGKLILVGKRKERLKKIAEEYENEASVVATDELERICEADIVITATSSSDAIIESENLKSGAVVYEVAQPRNVSRSVKEERKDVIIVDGAYARVPETIKFWWMSLPPQKTFGCMAETILLTLNGINGHRVGAVDLDFVKEIEKMAEKNGFSHAEFTSFNEPLK